MSVWHVASEWRVISEWHVMSVRHAFGHHRSSLGPQAWMIYKHFMARPDLRRYLRTGSDVSDVTCHDAMTYHHVAASHQTLPAACPLIECCLFLRGTRQHSIGGHAAGVLKFKKKASAKPTNRYEEQACFGKLTPHRTKGPLPG